MLFSGDNRPVTLPSNFGRAIDLSGLGKRAQVEASTTVGRQVNATNLAADFVALSKSKVVILLCWSARSPESLVVLDVLAKLQSIDEDRWVLGSVDVDAEPQVATALQVRTVPYAIALVAEQMIPLFEQSYPEAQVRAVVDKVLSIAAEQGLGSPTDTEVTMEPEEEQAFAALEVDDYATAEAAYMQLLGRKPNDNFAKLGLAQTQLLIRTKGLELAEVVRNASEDPEDLEKQIRAADCQMMAGNVEEAFNRLLQWVRTSSGEGQTRAKTHLLDLFLLVDPADVRLVKARSALANALF
jgi:putative thioredoxin